MNAVNAKNDELPRFERALIKANIPHRIGK